MTADAGAVVQLPPELYRTLVVAARVGHVALPVGQVPGRGQRLRADLGIVSGIGLAEQPGEPVAPLADVGSLLPEPPGGTRRPQPQPRVAAGRRPPQHCPDVVVILGQPIEPRRLGS